MSGAAGALALASVVPPPAAGAATPAAAPADEAGSPFDGLLGGEGATAEAESDAMAATGSTPLDPVAAASSTADAAPQAAMLPAADAPPPPMTDPATSAVLNALALRVATEARDASVPTPGPTGASAMPAGSPLPAPAPTIAAMPFAAPAAAPAGAAVDASVLASALAAPTLASRAGPGATTANGMPPGDAAPTADGDAAGTLDALLSTLDALLPPAPAKAPAGPSAQGAQAAGPAPTPAAMPLPAPAPMLAAPAAAADAASALLEGPIADVAADAAGAPNAPGSPASGPGAATPFALQFANAAGATPGAARADGAQTPIPVPFDSPRWGSEFATRVVSLAREQFSEAEIRVTPDELGPIEVKLRFDGDRVHAQFGAISPEAREALTANLHRLREMLAGEGLNLGQAFVGHHGQDAARRFDGQAARSGASGAEDEDAPLGEVRRAATVRRGLLDEFA